MVTALSNEQLDDVKTKAIQFLQSLQFANDWLNALKTDLANDNDTSCNAIELARYISWHMRYHGIHQDDESFADACAFQSVLFATNEILSIS